MDSKLYNMMAITFQRKKGGATEVGLLFNEGSKMIMDIYGREVTECWDYQRLEHQLSINLGAILGAIESSCRGEN